MAITGEMAFRYLHDEGEGFLADIIVAQYIVELVQKLKAAAIRIADLGQKVWISRFSLDEVSVEGSQARTRKDLEMLLHPLIEADTIQSPQLISILSTLRLDAYAALSAPPRMMNMVTRMRVGPEIEDPDEDFYVEWRHAMLTNWAVGPAPKHKARVTRFNVIKPAPVELGWRRRTPQTLAVVESLESWEKASAHAMDKPDLRLVKH